MHNKPNPSFQKIENFFNTTVEQYLPIVQTISIQAQLLQKLQKNHERLSKQYQQLINKNKKQKQTEQYTKEKIRAELKAEKQFFLEEALSVRQTYYQKEFESKKDQLLEEIFLKYQQICLLRQSKQHSTNLFTHLNNQLFGGSGSKNRLEGPIQSDISHCE